jgi:hypothetical protein
MITATTAFLQKSRRRSAPATTRPTPVSRSLCSGLAPQRHRRILPTTARSISNWSRYPHRRIELLDHQIMNCGT